MSDVFTQLLGGVTVSLGAFYPLFASYGRHMGVCRPGKTIPAKLAWFLQEMPAFLIPLFLMLTSDKPFSMGKNLDKQHHYPFPTCCIDCFFTNHRTFIYSLLTRGTPFPLCVMMAGGFTCSLNGFLQGHYLLHCLTALIYKLDFLLGLLLFYVGMVVNIHSDYILRNLRKPGEAIYMIPTGGLFKYVSGANYLGEIVEWFGYALATWSLPALAFAVFSLCFIGPRAYYHHRFYQEKFKDYPKLRKALIPFIF
uniref:3-oxo-5-alpha-steroid 4-dehydrogenase C-terminal domain-containing protein n=1 Tax=Anabas testudineus TaxID=64144 RepID=A0AAQ6IBW5_ANATE